MSTLKTASIALLVILIILGFTSFFTVSEGQQALVLRLGKLETNAQGVVSVFNPGLHFKVPFIEHDRVFDARIQTADIKSSRIVTAEKKYVLVDYYVKWKINNLARFYKSTGGNYQQASNLLQEQLNDTLRALFGKRTIAEVVSEDRIKIMAALLQGANVGAKNLGIDVIDVRIKKIDLPETVTNTVYQQMRAERERVATEHRSQGRATAEAIRAQADANVTVTIATAKAKGAAIRAEGEKIAAQMYANAYSKDPAFYSFYRSLVAYQQSFSNKHDVLVLKPDNQFFKYFNSATSSTSRRSS